MKIWDNESVSAVQGCFACTNWDVFTSDIQSLESLTNIVSSYINFCEDMLIPSKFVKIYPNTKPWVTRELNQKLMKNTE